MTALPDGTYDVIVVDVATTDDGDARIELTITLGPHIGRLLTLRLHHLRRSDGDDEPLSLLGVPGTLTVRQGRPTFRPEHP